MDDFKRIRIIEPAYAKYSGELGIVIFKDGLSVEKWPPHVRNRLAAAMRVAEVDEDGTITAAGAAEEMLRNRLSQAVVAKPLRVQTHAEKLAELIETATGEKQPAPFYTEDELEEVAREKKRQGLIEIAAKWRIRATNIPALINGILDAQEKYKERTEGKASSVRARYEAENGAALKKETEATADTKVAEVIEPAKTEEPKKRGRPAKQAGTKQKATVKAAKVPDPEFVGYTPVKPVVVVDKDAVKAAAITGDLSAALNNGE